MMYRPLRLFARAAAVISTTGLAALLGAGIASAHVEASPSTAAKGSTGEITLRVPAEEAHAATVKVEVTLPLDHPIASVSVKPVPGWSTQVQTAKLDKPIKTDEGAELTEAVHTITWTAGAGTSIQPGQFQEFTILAESLPDDTNQLVMPTTQTYDDGTVAQWNQPPAAPGAAEPDNPAPSVTLTADTAKPGAVSAASPTQATPAAPGQDGTARGLAGTAVGLAVLGLIVALGALVRGRRAQSS